MTCSSSSFISSEDIFCSQKICLRTEKEREEEHTNSMHIKRKYIYVAEDSEVHLRRGIYKDGWKWQH